MTSGCRCVVSNRHYSLTRGRSSDTRGHHGGESVVWTLSCSRLCKAFSLICASLIGLPWYWKGVGWFTMILKGRWLVYHNIVKALIGGISSCSIVGCVRQEVVQRIFSEQIKELEVAEDMMTAPVVTCSPTDTVEDVAKWGHASS